MRLVMASAAIILSLLVFMSVGPAFALSADCGSFCSVSVSPPSGGSGTAFGIQTGFTNTITTEEYFITFVAVVTPSSVVYTCGPTSGCNSVYVGESSSGTCTIPFGASGSLTSTGSINNCSGSNSAAWVEQSGLSISTLESDCESVNIGSYSGSPGGVGDTSQTGTYTVIACWQNPGAGETASSIWTDTTFSVTGSSSSVPEFPMGITILLVVMVPLLLGMRKLRPASERTAF